MFCLHFPDNGLCDLRLKALNDISYHFRLICYLLYLDFVRMLYLVFSIRA